MNRKRKMNDLYKGVFKNDKKSCLVDLKPLDKKMEVEKEVNLRKEENRKRESSKNDRRQESNIQNMVQKHSKALNVNLKVSKNAGFGCFFKKLREEVVDIFLAKNDYISFEGVINSDHINEIFNNSKSGCKKFTERDLVNLEKETSKRGGVNIGNASGIAMNRHPLNSSIYQQNNPYLNSSLGGNFGNSEPRDLSEYINPNTSSTIMQPNAIPEVEEECYENPLDNDQVEILYEDEHETIYKRRKTNPGRKVPQPIQKLNFNHNTRTQGDQLTRNNFNLKNVANLTNNLGNSGEVSEGFSNLVNKIPSNLQYLQDSEAPRGFSLHSLNHFNLQAEIPSNPNLTIPSTLPQNQNFFIPHSLSKGHFFVEKGYLEDSAEDVFNEIILRKKNPVKLQMNKRGMNIRSGMREENENVNILNIKPENMSGNLHSLSKSFSHSNIKHIQNK